MEPEELGRIHVGKLVVRKTYEGGFCHSRINRRGLGDFSVRSFFHHALLTREPEKEKQSLKSS